MYFVSYNIKLDFKILKLGLDDSYWGLKIESLNLKDLRNMQKLFNLAVILLPLTLVNCAGTREKFQNPFRHVISEAYWVSKPNSKDLRRKVGTEITGDVLSYLRENNLSRGKNTAVAPFELSKKEKLIIDRAFAGLPQKLVKKVSPLIRAIYFVEGLGSSGIAEIVYDSSGNPLSSFLVFDRSVLNLNANEWCTKKERTPFLQDGTIKITCQLEKYTSSHGAFQYILLHEIGHVLQINNPQLPFPSLHAENAELLKDSDYFKISWQLNKKGAIVPLAPLPTQNKCKFDYYLDDPPCSAKEAELFYGDLAQSTFATPNSVKNPVEDFADGFANYIHTQVLKKAFIITIEYAGKKLVYKDCWNEQRCEAKKKIFEAFSR